MYNTRLYKVYTSMWVFGYFILETTVATSPTTKTERCSRELMVPVSITA